MVPDTFSQRNREKDAKANASFAAGEFYEAIDLYKTAYNKIKDKNKKRKSFLRLPNAIELQERLVNLNYGIKKPSSRIIRIHSFFFGMGRC
jgi:hypothetical protein